MSNLQLKFLSLSLLIGLTGCASDQVKTKKPKVLVKNAAWTWFNDERAIFDGSNLYIGYVDTAGYSSMAFLSVDSDDNTQSYRLGSFKEKDDHNNPAFLRLSNERILAVYAAHHTEAYWYWRFGDSSETDTLKWSAEYNTGELDAKTTYSNLFQLSEEDGKIYNFFRGTNFDPVFMKSDDGGRNWSNVHHFITSGDQRTRPYVKYASNDENRIDMLFTQAHPRDAKTNIYHAYYENGNLYKSDGTFIQSMPGKDSGPMPVDSGTLVYDANEAGRGWVWDLEYNQNDSPVAVYISARDSTIGNDLRYRYARWNSDTNQWNEQEIAYAGTHLYDGENHYAGGITIDPENTNIIYLSSDIHPASGDTTAHYQIYKGITTDEGNTWRWETITPNAASDNIRPTIPRNRKEHHVVLWLRGNYTTYTEYDTDIIGLIE